MYKFVKAPTFVRKDEQGTLRELMCKMCGTVIAGFTERIVGYEMDRAGNKVKVVSRQFTRFHNYTELKIAFSDGSFHVTNGCSACLSMSLPPAALDELHRADQEESPDGYTERERERADPTAVAVRHDAGGIT